VIFDTNIVECTSMQQATIAMREEDVNQLMWISRRKWPMGLPTRRQEQQQQISDF
jgi:hypothetical protein